MAIQPGAGKGGRSGGVGSSRAGDSNAERDESGSQSASSSGTGASGAGAAGTGASGTGLGATGTAGTATERGHGAEVPGTSDRWGTTGTTEEHRTRERASHAREMTTELAHRAGDRARERIEDVKHRAADELHFVADALRNGVRQSNRESAIGPYLERVAEQVDRWSDMVENRSVNDMMRSVEDFARERPALFLGGCFALGVAAARFLKTSEPTSRELTTRGEFGYETSRGISSGYGTSSSAEVGYGTRGAGDTGQGWGSPSAGSSYDTDRSR